MEDRLAVALKEQGIRLTPQRALIWKVLSAGGHFTATQIMERAGESLPGLERSTIYRTLDVLKEAGLVVESPVPGGPSIYETEYGPHFHLICENCQRISHPEDTEHRRTLKPLSHQSSFEVHERHVIATGLCASCAA